MLTCSINVIPQKNCNMIYVEEKSFSRQIDVIEHLNTIEKFDVILWFYLGNKQQNICGLKLAQKSLIEGEQITHYWKDQKPHKTRRVSLTTELLTDIRASEKSISKNCDSIALYRPGIKEWLACAISHEGMCIIREDQYLEALKVSGLNASTEKPEWW